MSEKLWESADEINLQEDHWWGYKISKIHKTMVYMEKNKYLEPHYSFSFDKFAAFMNSFNERTDSTAAISNMSSLTKPDQIVLAQQKREYWERINKILHPSGRNSSKSYRANSMRDKSKEENIY